MMVVGADAMCYLRASLADRVHRALDTGIYAHLIVAELDAAYVSPPLILRAEGPPNDVAARPQPVICVVGGHNRLGAFLHIPARGAYDSGAILVVLVGRACLDEMVDAERAHRAV